LPNDLLELGLGYVILHYAGMDLQH